MDDYLFALNAPEQNVVENIWLQSFWGESISVYVSLLRSSNFCLIFSQRNMNLISPKSISTPIHRKSFRIAIQDKGYRKPSQYSTATILRNFTKASN